jgi:hypothetical protein
MIGKGFAREMIRKSFAGERKRPRALRLAGALALIAVCGGFACNKEAAPATTVLPEQTFVLDIPNPVLAQRPCANWTWAAALESLLQQAGVELKQDFWIVRAHGGLVCLPQAGSPAELARATTGNYILDDGRKLRLEARHSNGAPASVDQYILRLRSGQPYLLFWNSQVYLLHGVVYDEYIASTGDRMFQVRELKLLDLHPQARERETVFDRTQHDPRSIQAVMEVTVSIDPGTDWQRKRSDWQ